MKNKSKKQKPLRNCDVGTVRQQSKRFARYCKHESGRLIGVAFSCVECPLSKYSDCSLAWAQMPYNVSRHGHPTLNPGDKCTACDGVDELREMVVRALSARPRNCDRFATLPDALAAWRDVDPREAGPFDLWLFDTAKEGGAK